MITHSLRTLFLAQSAITSLVPAQTVQRVSMPCVFCDDAPQGANPPYIVLHPTDGDPMLTLDNFDPSLVSDDIDVDVVSYKRPQARQISNVICEFFRDYKGFRAKGSDSSTATVLNSTNGTLAIVGGADGTKGVKLPSFTGTFQVANVQQSYVLNCYLPNGTLTTIAAGTIATYTNTAGTYSQTSTTTTNAPEEVVHAVIFQGDDYTYDYPDQGRDTKFHIVTTTFQVQSEEGV